MQRSPKKKEASSPQPVELLSDEDHSARSRHIGDNDKDEHKYNQAIRRVDRESGERMKESTTNEDSGKFLTVINWIAKDTIVIERLYIDNVWTLSLLYIGFN